MVFGAQSSDTETAKAGSPSLSLNWMLVSGLALGNGYGTVQALTGEHLSMIALAVTGGHSSLVTLTVFVVEKQTVATAVSVTLWCGPSEAIGLPSIVPIRSSTTWMLEAAAEPVLVITYV